MSDSLQNGAPSAPRTPLSATQLGLLAKALGIVFLAAGLAKLVAPNETTLVFAVKGLPHARLLGEAVGVAEMVGGTLLLLGFWRRAVATALFITVIPAAVMFHIPFSGGAGALKLQALNLAFDAAILVGLWSIAR